MKSNAIFDTQPQSPPPVYQNDSSTFVPVGLTDAELDQIQETQISPRKTRILAHRSKYQINRFIQVLNIYIDHKINLQTRPADPRTDPQYLQDLLNQLSSHKNRADLLSSNGQFKAQRIQDYQTSETLTWSFKSPRKEHFIQLKSEMEQCRMNTIIIENLFSKSYKNQIHALDLVEEIILQYSDKAVNNLDLILKWASLTFHTINPILNLSVTCFLFKLFDLLKSDVKYTLTEYEASSFLPHFTLKLGDPRSIIRKAYRLLTRKIFDIYDHRRLFKYLSRSLITGNRLAKIEVLQELGYMIKKHGIERFKPHKFMIELSSFMNDEDTIVKQTVLDLLTVCIFSIDKPESDFFIANISDENGNIFADHLLANYPNNIYNFQESINVDKIISTLYSMKAFFTEKYEIGICSRIEYSIYETRCELDNIEKSILNALNTRTLIWDKKSEVWLVDFIYSALHHLSDKILSTALIICSNESGVDVAHVRECNFLLIKLFNEIIKTDIFKHTHGLYKVKKIMFNFFEIIIDPSLRKYELKNHVTNLFARLLSVLDINLVLFSFIWVLRSVSKQKYENKMKKISDYVAGAVYALYEDQGVDFDPDLKRNNQSLRETVYSKLKYDIVYREVELFLKDYPIATWETRECDTPFRIIKHIIYLVTNTKKIHKLKIVTPYDMIGMPKNSEVNTLFYENV